MAELQQQRHVNADVRSLIFIAASLLVFVAGSWMFFSNWAYRDAGQLWVYGAFVVFTVGMYLAISHEKYALVVLLGALVLSSVVYSQNKYAWRRAYIDSANAGKPFALEEYITAYPTYEEHLFGKYTGAPDPVGFYKDCIEPTEHDAAVGGDCASLSTIQDAYRIDAQSWMDTQLQKMRDTAKKVKDGTFKTSADLQSCIFTKECASIPLLPEGVKAEAIDPNSNAQYFVVRKAFWGLVHDEKLNPAICDSMVVCKALVKAKAIEVNYDEDQPKAATPSTDRGETVPATPAVQ